MLLWLRLCGFDLAISFHASHEFSSYLFRLLIFILHLVSNRLIIDSLVSSFHLPLSELILDRIVGHWLHIDLLLIAV